MKYTKRPKSFNSISLEDIDKNTIKAISSDKLSDVYNIVDTWNREIRMNGNPWVQEHFKNRIDELYKHLTEIIIDLNREKLVNK